MMVLCGGKPYHARLKPVNEIEHQRMLIVLDHPDAWNFSSCKALICRLLPGSQVVPVDEDEVHGEVMWKENVHQEQRSDVKYNSNSKNPPAPPAPEYG